MQAQILNLLAELRRELGVAHFVITDNIGVVEYTADRVAVMQTGRIVEQVEASAVLREPQPDYTQILLAVVPRLGAAA